MGDVVDMIQAKREMRRRARQVAAVDEEVAYAVGVLSDATMTWNESDIETLNALVTERLLLRHPALFSSDDIRIIDDDEQATG
jgi:hypothetical protein